MSKVIGMSVNLISTDFVNNVSRFSDKHRYLIDASNEESLKESLASVGNKIGIADADTQKMLSWFGCTKEEWVLLYDNADDPKVRLHSFLPDCRHGNVLITTRNADYRTLAHQKSRLEVSMLEELVAVKLLLQLSEQEGTEKNNTHALEIARS